MYRPPARRASGCRYWSRFRVRERPFRRRWARSQAAKSPASRPRSTSIERCPSVKVDQHRAVVVAAAQRELVDTEDNNLADRWIWKPADHPQQLDELTPISNLAANREPARPVSANAMATNAVCRPGLRLACRSVNPGICSTNVPALQST